MTKDRNKTEAKQTGKAAAVPDEGRKLGKKAGKEPAHEAPAHGAPAHGAPAHGAPAHGAPAHGAPTFELVKEARLADLLEEVMGGEFEASGVHCHNNLLYIVFDNYPNIACLTTDLERPSDVPSLIRQRGERIGFEDLTYQPYQRRWYCLIEATEYEPDLYKSRIEEYDETFRFIESLELDFRIKGSNKGIEGLSHVRYKGEDYLLALCEGNACKSGAAGREGGKGRILLFQRGVRRWEHVGTVKLPKSVRFIDYSALDVRDRWVTVVSQESSAAWIGRIKQDPDGLDDLFEDEGRVFLFPRGKKGKPVYCNLEGVTWIGDRQLVVVSDKAKAGKQPPHCTEHDQSIHIFTLAQAEAGTPAGAPGAEDATHTFGS